MNNKLIPFSKRGLFVWPQRGGEIFSTGDSSPFPYLLPFPKDCSRQAEAKSLDSTNATKALTEQSSKAHPERGTMTSRIHIVITLFYLV